MRKTLYELVRHYQETGELLPEVYEIQMTYLIDNIQDIFDEYIEEYDPDGDTFQDHFVRRIHDWLVDKQFTHDMMNKSMDEYFDEATDDYLDEMLKLGVDKNEDGEGLN